MRKKLLAQTALITAFLLPLTLYAKSINLYEQPQDGAKVVNTIDSDIGIIPIFSPEKSDWIKVADPRNGNVGWIKMKDLSNGGSSEYTFTQRFVNTGSSPQSYQIIQFGGPKKLSPNEVQTLIKQNEDQQSKIQEKINKTMQNMVNDMNKLYNANSSWMNNSAPIFMPVIVMPSNNNLNTEKK